MNRLKTLAIVPLVFIGWLGFMVLGVLAILIGAPFLQLTAFLKACRTKKAERPKWNQKSQIHEFTQV